MTALSYYDPDESEKKKEPQKPEELKIGDRCPTCKQKVERRAPHNEVWRVVMVYKMSIGYEKDDKKWDKAFGPMNYQWAKKMIDFLGRWEDAADCIQDTQERIKEWNSEAVMSLQNIFLKHAGNWKKERIEKQSRI